MLNDTLFAASKILWQLLRPNTFMLVLAVVGAAALWRGRRWGRWPTLIGLGWFVLIIATPLATWMTWPLENRFSRPAAAPTQVDGIIILGGAVDQDLTTARGIPALTGAAERMTEAVALSRRFPEARIVFTGGSANPLRHAMTEADVARLLFGQLGLEGDRITYENAARNTAENAVLSRALARPQPGETWLLVTSASHMPRSVGVFRAVGWPVVPWPVNYSTGLTSMSGYDEPFSERLGMAEWALREYLGLVAYRALGRTDALFPAP